MQTYRKSAVAMMMVAGGLVMAMPAVADTALTSSDTTTVTEITPCIKPREGVDITPCIMPRDITPCIMPRGDITPCIKPR